MAGAVFGAVHSSLFIAGAIFGEIWNDSRSAKFFIFPYITRVASAKSNLCCRAGCGLTGSRSDHGRIMLGSAAHCTSRCSRLPKKFSRIFECHLCDRRNIGDIGG